MTSKGGEGCAFVAGYNLEHKHSQNASDASRPTRFLTVQLLLISNMTYKI